jgi:hypothetical protein
MDPTLFTPGLTGREQPSSLKEVVRLILYLLFLKESEKRWSWKSNGAALITGNALWNPEDLEIPECSATSTKNWENRN